MKVLGVEVGDERRKPGRHGELRQLLDRNAALRDVFTDSPASRARLAELQKWQSQRLLKSHADLRANPRLSSSRCCGADASAPVIALRLPICTRPSGSRR